MRIIVRVEMSMFVRLCYFAYDALRMILNIMTVCLSQFDLIIIFVLCVSWLRLLYKY